ncbi:phage holin family protein [Deinococcus wulumuqiensis]
MEERKSMGSALVDVFDAGVVLVKSEINALGRKVGEIAKAKGIGVVLLLAALGPLLLGLIFLILAVFYGLMRLGLAAWAAALVIALVSLAITGALIALGLKKLSSEVDTEMPRRPVNMGSSESQGAQSVGGQAAGGQSAHGVPATSLKYPVPAAAAAPAVSAGTDGGSHSDVSYSSVAHSGAVSGSVQPSVEGAARVPVYESDADGRAHMYGDRLNEKLDGDHHHDPNLQNPVVLRDAPGIAVSTTPTFREDMRREGLSVDDVPPTDPQQTKPGQGGH